MHVVSEYGVELTKCEGPSMMPTILPFGDEIILFERMTHRIWGIDGGDVGDTRSQRARQKQIQYELATGKQIWPDAHLLVPPTEPAGILMRWVNLWRRLNTGICVGDVVVLQHPEREGTICKRVLGLPGDMVIRSHPFHGGRRSSIQEWFVWNNEEDEEHLQDYEENTSPSSLLVVPDGHIWVEGDNSTNSSDSRHYGPVPAALVMGKVLIRVWPLRGQALIIRGPKPQPPLGAPSSGSTVLPAGYEGEAIQQ